MPDVISPVPSLSVHQDDVGTIAGNFAIPGSTVKAVGAINWAALLQAVVSALPAIMAIIAAFSSSPAPVPKATIDSPHEVNP